MLEQAVNLFYAVVDCLNFLLVLVHIIKRDSADWDFKQVVNIINCNRADEFGFKRFKTIHNSFDYALFCFLIFDFLINALFYENAFKGSQVKFFEQGSFFKFKFLLKNSNKLFCVILNNLSTGHLHRHIIFDYKKITVNCLLTVCKGIKGIYNILCVNSTLKTNFDIYFVACIILN